MCLFCSTLKVKPQSEIESQVISSTETPKKSSSKSSIKSKSSKTSLKSTSGSTVSVKNETTTEVLDRYYHSSRLLNNNIVSLYDSLNANPRREPKTLQIAYLPSNPSPAKLHLNLSLEHKTLSRMKLVLLLRYAM